MTQYSRVAGYHVSEKHFVNNQELPHVIIEETVRRLSYFFQLRIARDNFL